MDIKSLLNNQLIDRKRNERLADVKTDAKLDSPKNDAVKESGDQVSLSTSVASASDLSFAKSIYKKLDESTLDRVRAIRSKVEDGTYTSETSIKKLAIALENDIYSLEADSYISDAKIHYPIDIEQLKKSLSENSEIFNEVADRLSKILSNF